MKKTTKSKKINHLAKSLRTAGEESRIKILCALIDKDQVCVSDMAEKLHTSVAVTSHHLQELDKARLVEAKRDGKKMCYYLAKNSLTADLKRFICKYK